LGRAPQVNSFGEAIDRRDAPVYDPPKQDLTEGRAAMIRTLRRWLSNNTHRKFVAGMTTTFGRI